MASPGFTRINLDRGLFREKLFLSPSDDRNLDLSFLIFFYAFILATGNYHVSFFSCGIMVLVGLDASCILITRRVLPEKLDFLGLQSLTLERQIIDLLPFEYVLIFYCIVKGIIRTADISLFS